MAGSPAPRQAHFATLALRCSLRCVALLEWRGPLHPARLTSLRSHFAARSAALRFLNGGVPCTPPSSLRYARTSLRPHSAARSAALRFLNREDRNRRDH